MYKGLTVGAVIPARDEAANIAAVVSELLSVAAPNGGRLVDDLVVCDNGSTDATAALARTAGARVVAEPTPGYGIACQCAVQALRPVDVVLFVDGDRAFDVQQSLELLAAIDKGADLVIGSRSLGSMQPGALSAPQLAGNWVAGRLLYLFLARQGDRSRPLSGDPLRRATPAEHVRPGLRLDGGNADKSSAKEVERGRSAGGNVSAARRQVQSRRHGKGCGRGQPGHPRHDPEVVADGHVRRKAFEQCAQHRRPGQPRLTLRSPVAALIEAWHRRQRAEFRH